MLNPPPQLEDEVLPGLRFRSALLDYPGGSLPRHPTVAIIVPVYNEAHHIVRVADSIVNQDYARLTEIYFIDGMSDDGTWELLQKIKYRDPRIIILSNPKRLQAAALNLGLARARTDIVARFDAHADYAPDLVQKAVDLLLKSGAAGVGPKAVPSRGDTPKSHAIAAVMESRLGAGAANFRNASASGWVDTIWNGTYWTHVVSKAGLLREDYGRLEDNDFNHRVRALGYGLYCSAELRAFYHPRRSFHELWKQYASNGAEICRALFFDSGIIRPRHIIPLAFVLILLASLALALVWRPAALVTGVTLFAYTAVLLSVSLTKGIRQPGIYALYMPLAFATVHFSYGIGSLLALRKCVFQLWLQLRPQRRTARKVSAIPRSHFRKAQPEAVLGKSSIKELSAVQSRIVSVSTSARRDGSERRPRVFHLLVGIIDWPMIATAKFEKPVSSLSSLNTFASQDVEAEIELLLQFVLLLLN